MSRIKSGAPILMVFLGIVLLPWQVEASYIHTYQGNNFETFSTFSAYDKSMSVSGHFTTAAPLAASTAYDFAHAPLPGFMFSFFDGAQVLSMGSAVISLFDILTDKTAAISQWLIALGQPPTPAGPEIGTRYYTSGSLPATALDYGRAHFTDPDYGLTGSKGTWSSTVNSTTTPLPSTLLLAGSGLLGAVGFRSRKNRRK